jgi:hypothetical protein
MTCEVAKERGVTMARERKVLNDWKTNTYYINNNPYERHLPQHVAWHNAFYEERRRLGRKVR